MRSIFIFAGLAFVIAMGAYISLGRKKRTPVNHVDKEDIISNREGDDKVEEQKEDTPPAPVKHVHATGPIDGALPCAHEKWKFVDDNPGADGIEDVIIILIVCEKCEMVLAKQSRCISCDEDVEVYDKKWGREHGIEAHCYQ